jgi:aryl-alcohol dehydrogenase-like predicted oxidoreductase
MTRDAAYVFSPRAASSAAPSEEFPFMRYRPLGRTGQFVSEICLGTMTFAGGAGIWRAIGTVDQKGATALVERALAAGVNFIDTADVYSEGQSEVMLGQALRDLKVAREDVIVATKVRGRTGQGTNSVGLSRGHIMDQIAGSLKRLGLDHVDLYQIHGFDPVTPIEETLRALAAGVNFIDTADVYSEGQSEVMLGQALRDLKVAREDVIVATKVRGRTGQGPNSVGLSRGHIMDQIAGSLKRLGLDHVDLYQIHGFDPVTPIEETLRALDDCVSRGLVRTIGCSNLAAWQIMKALGISERRGFARFETVQAYYTIAGRDLEREVVPLVEDQGLGVMVWSPLAGGLLSGKFARDGKGPEGARRVVFDFPPVDKDRAFTIVDAMRPIAEAHDVSVARVALAWLLQRKGVMSVIVGAKTIEQLDDNLAAAKLSLSAAEIATLDTVSALPPEYPGWMIGRQSEGRVPAEKIG